MGIDLRVATLRLHLDKFLFLVGAIYLLGVGLWLNNQRQRPRPSPLAQTSVEDAQFIAYLQQSLRLLQNTPPRLTSPPPTTANSLPLVALPPQLVTPPVPSLPALTERNQAPNPVALYKAPPLPVPQAVQPALPPVPQAPLDGVNTVPPMVKAKQAHSLVGVLESGERSSALFSWDGLTQRIQVGEAVGGSGWTLIGVNNQKAILSRQGKTRYLEVGQSF